MPRLRLRRLLLTIICVACCTLLVMNFTSNSSQQQALLFPGKTGDFSPGIQESGARRKPKFDYPVVQSEKPKRTSSVSHSTMSTIVVNHQPQNHHQMERKDNPMAGLSNSLLDLEKPTNRLWFMKKGDVRPRPAKSKPLLWPEQDAGDRIVEQLMYVPTNYTSSWNFTASSTSVTSVSGHQKLKKILLYFGKGGWNDLPLGRTVFLRDKCPVNTCELTTALRDAESADAIFFKDRFLWPFYKRNPNQVWILFLLECPLHTQAFKNLKNVFNWTATYRHDSDLVAPYEKFVPYDASAKYQPDYVRKTPPTVDHYSYLANKTKKVAWFVSNCNAKNKRLEYAKELGQHIEVDIYGSCGNKKCPRTLTNRCFKMLDKDYKFYLAFENSNCKDYITEKFFVNGLSRNIVPIVMGGRPEDYARAAPPHSYIHVDDYASPKELAAYLNLLDKNHTLYAEYFRWKDTGEFVNTYFWCRMCGMLHHEPLYHKTYPDMHKWWAGPGTCNAGHWRKQEPGTTTIAARVGGGVHTGGKAVNVVGDNG